MGEPFDFVFAPVMANMCKLESVYDGTLTLEQIALANDLIAIRNENEWRAHDAIKRQAGAK